jgi:hypothetical protein
MNALLKSKRFWLAASTLLAVALRERLNLPVTDDQVHQVVLVVAAWIVGDSLRGTAITTTPEA